MVAGNGLKEKQEFFMSIEFHIYTYTKTKKNKFYKSRFMSDNYSALQSVNNPDFVAYFDASPATTRLPDGKTILGHSPFKLQGTTYPSRTFFY